MKELHIIIGAGAVGLTLLEKLNEKNIEAKIITRNGVEEAKEQSIKADVLNIEELEKACVNATVIYFCATPAYSEWKDKLMLMTKNVINVSSKLNAVLVYADNLYMYGETNGQIFENTQCNASDEKGIIRKDVANEIMNAHKKGIIKATIGRASNFYGPRVDASIIGNAVFKDAINKSNVKLLGNVDTLHSYTYIKDFAETLIILGTNEKAYGEVFHVPNAKTITTKDFILELSKQLNKKIKLTVASKRLVSFLGIFSKNMKELLGGFYMFDKPLVVNNDKFNKYFTMTPTSFEDGIKETILWTKNNQ